MARARRKKNPRGPETRDRKQITIKALIKADHQTNVPNIYRHSPTLYLCILPLVLGNGRFPKVCFTSEFKTHLHWAEKVRTHFIGVLERGHDISRTCEGFKQLNLLQWICHSITSLQSVSVFEQNFHSFIVISLGSEHNCTAVYLQSPHSWEWSASVEELPGLVALAPLEDAVEGVRVLFHGGRVHCILHQLRCVCQGFDLLITLKIFCRKAAWGKIKIISLRKLLMLFWFCNGSNGSCSQPVRFPQFMFYLINYAWTMK